MSRRRSVDLTVGAIPLYGASMGVERWLLRRRAAREGSSAADYRLTETLANLTMGVLSLLVPLATGRVITRVAPQRSKLGKGLLALAAG